MAKLPTASLSTKGLASSGGNIVGLFVAFAFDSFGVPISSTSAIIIGTIISAVFWYLTSETAFDAIIKRYKDRTAQLEALQTLPEVTGD